MTIGKPFLPGRAKTGGRIKGGRNKISEAFLHDLAAEWEVSGAAALKVMSKEDPSGFVKVTAALLPKEFEITQTALMEISDEQLDLLTKFAERELAGRAFSTSGGEGSETHH